VVGLVEIRGEKVCSELVVKPLGLVALVVGVLQALDNFRGTLVPSDGIRPSDAAP